MRLGILTTHPIQYQVPLFRALAREVDLRVYFCHRPSAEEQGAGFGVAFTWDVPLLDGYAHTFLVNRATHPDTATFNGCDTPQIATALRRERFDAFLVMGWYNRSLLQGIIGAWRTRTPLLVRGDSHLHTPRSTTKRLVKEVIYRQFIPRFDGYLVVGKRAREYYRYYGADPEQMFFVPHFVDNEWFRAHAAKADPSALRREVGAADNALVLLFVGKLIPKKNPADVLRAAFRLQSGGQPVHVVYAGSGELEKDLRALAVQLGVPVHFAGFQNQTALPQYYVGADLLVLPSSGDETWGLVVNEAMACGLPAAVSEMVGCGPDLIAPGLTGFTFPTGDVDALARGVAAFTPRLGTAAVRHALEAKMAQYSLDTACEGTIDAVQTVGRKPRRTPRVSSGFPTLPP